MLERFPHHFRNFANAFHEICILFRQQGLGSIREGFFRAAVDLDVNTVRPCRQRLTAFVQRYLPFFYRDEQRQHAETVLKGKLTGLQRKTTEPIATQAGLKRRNMQLFVGDGGWHDDTVLGELRRHVAEELADPDAVFVLDGSGFPKKGDASCGVDRQWCGRLGKVDHCQVALYWGYVSRKGHTLVDLRLSLPQAWTQDKARLDKAGVPTTHRGDRTRHQLAREMLATNGAALPQGWIAGDDEMGRPYWFRRRLAALGERSVLAVPSKTLCRDLESPLPPYGGLGRRPQRPWQSVAVWSQARDEAAWQRVDVRDGSKGPLVVEGVKRRVVSRTQRRQQGDEELVVVIPRAQTRVCRRPAGV